MKTEDVKGEMSNLRTTIALLVSNLAQFISEAKVADELEGQNKGEMLANATIALRALEDAAMRAGKVIQAADGGVSPLGGPTTPAK